VLELEQRVGARLTAPCELVARAGMEQERRSLRLAVRDLRWRREAEPRHAEMQHVDPRGTASREADSRKPDSIILEFRLGRGAYATAVLREVFALDADYDDSST